MPWQFQPAGQGQPNVDGYGNLVGFYPGTPARWVNQAGGNTVAVPATGQFASAPPSGDPVGITPSGGFILQGANGQLMQYNPGSNSLAPVDPASAQQAIAAGQEQMQQFSSVGDKNSGIGSQAMELMSGPGAVAAIPLAGMLSGFSAAGAGAGAGAAGAGGATDATSAMLAQGGSDWASGLPSAMNPGLAEGATGSYMDAAGAGAGAAGAAGAGAGASGLPSWLSALGPGLGVASGLNTLLGTKSNTGPGSGGLPSVGQSSQTVGPGNLAAYQKLLGIDPSGMIAAGDKAGTQYSDLATQMQQYQAMMQAQAGNAAGAQTDLQAQGQKEFGAGNAMQTAGLGIMGNAQPLITAGNAAWNTAQDPQSALYARTAQQLQDQSRAATSARGIGMSPEAAGIEGGTMSNFNIDWQNQQLQRMLSGLSGMGGAYNAAANQYGAGTSAFGAGTGAVNAGTGAYNAAGNYGRLYGADTAAAAGFGAAAPGYTLQAGAVPFQTRETAYGAPLQAGVDYATATNTAFNPNLANYNTQQQKFNANQSAAGMNALLTGMNGLFGNNMGGNTPGSWLTSAFGGGNTGGGTGYDPNQYMNYLNTQQ